MMGETVIFYFTGTGNSLFIAKALAQRLQAKLIPMVSMIGKNVQPQADTVGFVFPVHNSAHNGLPTAVSDFLNRVVNLQGKYVFAICNSGFGAIAGDTELKRLISEKDGKLSAMFAVKMPYNVSPVPSAAEQSQLLADVDRKIEAACKVIRQKKEIPFGVPLALRIVFFPLIPMFRAIFLSKMKKQSGAVQAKTFAEVIPQMDKTFKLSESCNGCGICAKLCPVGNIRMENGKPQWQHHCTTCLACFHWCPQGAIESSYSPTQYRNPNVTLSEVLLQASSKT